MKYSCKLALSIALVLGGSLPALAQETATSSQEAAKIEQAHETAFGNAIWAAVGLASSDLAADDGHYLAQNKTELQTYYDLKLSFQYMGEEYLRRQLGIADDEGIILTAADKSGQGFKNGFRDGDIVLKVDGEPVKTQYELVIALSQDRGKERKATLLREGKPLDLTVVLTAQQEEAKQWVIGVSVDEISGLTKTQLKIDGGVAVSQLTEGGAAQEAGIQVHDVITHVDGQQINTLEELKQWVEDANGKQLTLAIIRTSKRLSIDVEPRERAVASSMNFRIAPPNGEAPLNRNLIWSTQLASEGGQLTMVPKFVDAQGDYALAWQYAAPKNKDANSADDQSKRIEAIESTLQLLQEQLQELKSAQDR